MVRCCLAVCPLKHILSLNTHTNAYTGGSQPPAASNDAKVRLYLCVQMWDGWDIDGARVDAPDDVLCVLGC